MSGKTWVYKEGREGKGAQYLVGISPFLPSHNPFQLVFPFYSRLSVFSLVLVFSYSLSNNPSLSRTFVFFSHLSSRQSGSSSSPFSLFSHKT